MSQQTLAELRESLAKLESGQLRSDLFETPVAAAEHDPGDTAGSTVGYQEGATSNPGEDAQPEASSGPLSDEYSKARAVVLRKLTGSPKSRQQLDQALREKDFDPETVVAVLDRMEEVELIDDAGFAHSWVRSRHELKGLGAAALRRELQEKGVAEDYIEDALQQLSIEDENAAARELIDSKLRTVTVPAGETAEERKERDKLTRRLVAMLGRRGHAPGTAFQLVKEALEERTE